MRGRYFFVPGKVGNRSGDAQHALVRTCGQVELVGRALEQRPAAIAGGAVFLELLTFETRVTGTGALVLRAPGIRDARGNLAAGLCTLSR